MSPGSTVLISPGASYNDERVYWFLRTVLVVVGIAQDVVIGEARQQRWRIVGHDARVGYTRHPEVRQRWQATKRHDGLGPDLDAASKANPALQQYRTSTDVLDDVDRFPKYNVRPWWLLAHSFRSGPLQDQRRLCQYERRVRFRHLQDANQTPNQRVGGRHREPVLAPFVPRWTGSS